MNPAKDGNTLIDRQSGGRCAAAICLIIGSVVYVSGQNSTAIRQRMQSFVDNGAIPGAVTLVIKKDRVISFEAVGYRDLETRRPMTPDTIFDIRSMTKPVTAIGVMILMEEGKLALSDPVEKYLPEFKSSAFKDARATPSDHDSTTVNPHGRAATLPAACQ